MLPVEFDPIRGSGFPAVFSFNENRRQLLEVNLPRNGSRNGREVRLDLELSFVDADLITADGPYGRGGMTLRQHEAPKLMVSVQDAF